MPSDWSSACALPISPAGDFSWTVADDDLAEVIAHHRLHAPAVVGHSLGGLVAARWASEHPECSFAINLDGHANPTTVDEFDGPERERSFRLARAFFEESLADASDPWLTAMVRELDALDAIATYQATRCRLLIVSSESRRMLDLFDPSTREAFAAWLRAFEGRLASVARTTPLLEVAALASGHDIHLEQPVWTAGQIIRLSSSR